MTRLLSLTEIESREGKSSPGLQRNHLLGREKEIYAEKTSSASSTTNFQLTNNEETDI
jgi:hypothetical protein